VAAAALHAGTPVTIYHLPPNNTMATSNGTEGPSTTTAMNENLEISSLLLPHVDRHLALPVLNFLEEHAVYPKEELLQAKYELLQPTNMVHYLESLRKEIAGDSSDSLSPEIQAKADKVVQRREELRSKADKVIEIISNPEVAASLGQDKERNLTTLREKYHVSSAIIPRRGRDSFVQNSFRCISKEADGSTTPIKQLDVEQINHLYEYGQFSYSLGDYAAASDYLNSFRILSIDPSLTLSAYWGKLVANILEEPEEGEEKTYDAAFDELKLLKDDIESHRHSRAPAVQLQQRTAWLHWSLFVYFRHPKGIQTLVDSWTESTPEAGDKRRSYYLDTIQTSCPWLLRYLVAAAVVTHSGPLKMTSSFGQPSQGRKAMLSGKLFQILRVVEQEKYQYSDVITEFFRLLLGSVDFEGATSCLKLANEEVLKKDYFLDGVKADFTDRARHFMSEVYCRIHHKIDIA
jgi:translation initiation factor 3 subunit E